MRPADSPPLFLDHPLRRALNDEAHARPFAPADTPSRISSFMLLGAEPEAQRQALLTLTRALGLPEPSPGAVHYLGQGDGYALRWNGHTEFVRYSVLSTGSGDITDLSRTALDALPAELLSTLPGSMLVGVHVWVLPCPEDGPPPLAEIADWAFEGYPPVGAEIGDGRAVALTDLRLHPDPRSANGFARILLYNRDMAPNQTGRMLQRLVELETYRMLALLALPLAKRLQPSLAAMEAELQSVTGAMHQGSDGADDELLLDRITRLAAELEDAIAQSSYRFAATRAYYNLVCRRIEELREGRLPGLQPFQEFVERRLAPAIDTCDAVSRRLEQLSMRLQRATSLLRTRVEVESDAQRRELLVSMNRRAALQLRLQETVEGLSVAVLTYYVVGLVGYAAKGLKAAGLHVQPDLVTGIAIPVTAAVVAFGVHRLKQKLTQKH